MNRKYFIKNALPVSVISSLAISGALKYYGSHGFFQSPQRAHYEGRVLVLIQMGGGNDGLNTVIPLDQYQHLVDVRKNILIPDHKVLALKDSTITGLHPSMTAIRQMYDDREVSIIQGVGYANPDLSHFRSIDIWHSGSDSASTIPTGWLGRFLDREYLEFVRRNRSFDPPAIQIGASLSNALQGKTSNVGMVVRDTGFFYDLIPEVGMSAHQTETHGQLLFLRNNLIESKEYFAKVKFAARAQQNLSRMYPSPGVNTLADQLKVAAQLIGGGLETKVYIVTLKGFDTHVNQVEKTDPTKGNHADLLAKLSEAIAAFVDDLRLMGKLDKVLGMTYSEFGRRIRSNSSYGSDHGTAAPMMLFGSRLKGGLKGKNPEIASETGVNDNLPMQYDFRSVYASVLRDWFGVPPADVNAIMLDQLPVLDLFKAEKS